MGGYSVSVLAFPGSSTSAQWFYDDYTGRRFARVEKVVVHTTETMGWPGYDEGATAPNATGRPVVAQHGVSRIGWRAHFPADVMSRALRNEAGGVQTNADGAHQIELVGTCDPATAKKWCAEGHRPGIDFVYWPNAPWWALEGLAQYLAWCHKALGVPLVAAPLWVAYPASANPSRWARMTPRTWDSFRGVCGHQHVPENVHGDPGDLDIARVIARARDLVAPRPAPDQPTQHPQQEDDMPLTDADAQKVAQAVLRTRYAEYEDENGNLVRDNRTISDVLFATHANSVQAERVAAQHGEQLLRLEAAQQETAAGVARLVELLEADTVPSSPASPPAGG